MFLDKALAVLFAALFLLMLACDGSTTASETKEAVSLIETRTLEEDPAFWDYAASSNMLQVEIAQLAMEQARTEEIRAMGQKAVKVHGEALKQLRNLTRQKHIQLPDSLGAADQGLVEELRLLEGEEFDARYRYFILGTHRAQLDQYKEAILKAEDQRIRGWLIQMRSHLREEVNELVRIDSLRIAGE